VSVGQPGAILAGSVGVLEVRSRSGGLADGDAAVLANASMLVRNGFRTSN